MKKYFENIYDRLILQQRIYKNTALITEWNIGDFWDNFKQFIGLGPSKAQLAAKAAEQAAKNDPNKKIQKLAVQISDQDMNKAKALMVKNPTLIKHYNNLPTVEDQKAFIVGLLAQKQHLDKVENQKKFNAPQGKEAQMFKILCSSWGRKWAESKWKIAEKQNKVICINKQGKPYAVPKEKFEDNADKYLAAADKYAPKDDTLKDDILDVLAKEENGELLVKMCKIYIQAIGNEDKAKKTFEQKFEKGKICIFKNNKTTVVSKEKFLGDTDKYITMAQKNNPNSQQDADDLDPAELEDYNKFLKSIVTKQPLNMYSEKVFDIKVRKAAKDKQVLVLIEKSEEKSEEKAEEKSDKLINQAVITGAIITGTIISAAALTAMIAGSKLYKASKNVNTVIKTKDSNGKTIEKTEQLTYELRAINQAEFIKNQDEIINALEKIEKQINATASNNAKADKQVQFKEACKKFQSELPTGDISELCDTNDWGGNDFKLPQNIKLYDFKGKEVATWNSNEEIDSKEEATKLKEFLMSGLDKDTPAHPKSIANVLSKLIDTQYQAKEIQDEKAWEKMVKICQEQINKANAICSKYPDFQLK